jgi:hypothetical protein
VPSWYQGVEGLIERHTNRVIEALVPILHRIERKVDFVMTLVSVDDSVIAAIGANVSLALTGVQTIVAAETNPLQAADMTPITGPLQDLLTALQSPSTPVAPVDPTPVDPTPVDPTPVDPAPVDPTPVDPNPVVDPTA